jgi:hypothetical protein
VDVTVYLPDELGKKAKQAEINLSRTLRDAVTEELDRRKTMANTLQASEVHELELEDQDGRSYTGRITGALIASGGRDLEYEVFLAQDGRVILHDSDRHQYEELQDPEEDLAGWRESSPGAYADAMRALGIRPVIDL